MVGEGMGAYHSPTSPIYLRTTNCTSSKAAAIGTELCTNPAVRKIGFTGSTAVGKLLMAQVKGPVVGSWQGTSHS